MFTNCFLSSFCCTLSLVGLWLYLIKITDVSALCLLDTDDESDFGDVRHSFVVTLLNGCPYQDLISVLGLCSLILQEFVIIL